MTEMGEALLKVIKLVQDVPSIDLPRFLQAVTDTVMLERQRAIEILEAPMERLRKDAIKEDQSGGDSGSTRAMLKMLVDLRDRVADASKGVA